MNKQNGELLQFVHDAYIVFGCNAEETLVPNVIHPSCYKHDD